MLYSDYNLLTNDNINYTIDMLRLRANITNEKYSYIQYMLKTCYYDNIKNFYESFSISDFKYNYSIELKEGSSYWFGFIHNSEYIQKGALSNPKTEFNFTIEFNPNKVPINGFLNFVLKTIGFNNWIVKSCDIAMDLRINILDLCGFDKKRYKDIRIFNAGLDNRTVYIGRTNNRIKIYNKKIESSLDYDLTRVEISTKIDYDISKFDFYKLKINLPDIYLNNYLYTFDDYKDKTTLAILYAVQNGYPLSDLTRHSKEKIKKLLEGGYKVNLDEQCCNDILHNCINEIFKKD